MTHAHDEFATASRRDTPRSLKYAVARILCESIFGLLVWWIGVGMYVFLPPTSLAYNRYKGDGTLALLGGLLFAATGVLLALGLWGFAIIAGFFYIGATIVFIENDDSPVVQSWINLGSFVLFIVGWWPAHLADLATKPDWWQSERDEVVKEVLYCLAGGSIFALSLAAPFSYPWAEVALVPLYFWTTWMYVMRECD